MNEPVPCLEVRGLSKRYGGQAALRDVTLSISDGTIFSLLGPSGAGKSTVLKAILGLEKFDSGRILIDGQEITDLPTEDRKVGMVFQNYSLFPTMTVRENVAFPLIAREVRGIGSLIRFRFSVKRRDVFSRADEMLKLVQLESHGRKRPHQLSGGEQQRVAIARALIAEPRLLCLDEPFSALDRTLRAEMQQELLRLKESIGTTLLHITHDQTEAMLLSDRLGIIRNGQIQQVGTPADVYFKPNSEFVARFLGDCNVLPIISRERNSIITQDGIRILITSKLSTEHVSVGIRPETFTMSGGNGREQIQATVESRDFLGSYTQIRVRLSESIRAFAAVHNMSYEQLPSIGDRIKLYYQPDSVFPLT